MSAVPAIQQERGFGPALLGCVAAALVAVLGFGLPATPTPAEAAAPPVAPEARRVTTPGSTTTPEVEPPTPSTEAEATTKSEPTIPETIQTVFGADAPVALRVAECESRFDPGAVGPYGSIGVFQIHPPSHAWRVESVDGSGLTDPDTNIRVARQIQQDEGWRPWTCARRLGIA